MNPSVAALAARGAPGDECRESKGARAPLGGRDVRNPGNLRARASDRRAGVTKCTQQHELRLTCNEVAVVGCVSVRQPCGRDVDSVNAS